MSISASSLAAAGAGWQPATAAGQAQSSPAAVQGAASKEMFLQLLVAQIRHQNPLNPANGTEFVAQLAQFTELEATLDIRRSLEQIRAALSQQTQQGA